MNSNNSSYKSTTKSPPKKMGRFTVKLAQNLQASSPATKKSQTLTRENTPNERWVCISYKNPFFEGASQTFYKDEWIWLSRSEQDELGVRRNSDYKKIN